MDLRTCRCGGTPKAYEFVVQCSVCRTSTECYAKQEDAAKAWNEERDLVVRIPVKEG